MSNKQRIDGFYWCKRDDEWSIYWWSSNFQEWFSMHLIGVLCTSDFQKIDEERLKYKKQGKALNAVKTIKQ
jgi:hypothetical protein